MFLRLLRGGLQFATGGECHGRCLFVESHARGVVSLGDQLDLLAQELAQQELEVNAISAKLQGMTSMNDIVRTAVSELGRALGAQQASIRLGLDLGKGLPGASNGTGMIASGQHEARSKQ